MRDDISLRPGETKSISLPEGELTAGRDGRLWYFSYATKTITGSAPGPLLSATVAAHSAEQKLRIRFLLPLMPVMFRFPEPIAMVPDASILLGLNLPLDLVLEDASGTCLWRLSHASLGRAWYGSVEYGEECLALRALPIPIKREMDAPGGPASAGLPVRLINNTKTRIEVPRLTLSTGPLRLYARAKEYLADLSRLSYEPDEDIRVASSDLRGLAQEENLVVSDQARVSHADLIVKKGMHLFRGLTGWEAR